MSATLESILTQIKESQKTTADGASFFPPDELRRLFNQEIVTNLLVECQVAKHRISNVAIQICESGIITFALLIWLGSPEKIVELVDMQELDNRLPFHEASAPSIMSSMPQIFDAQWSFRPVHLRKHQHRQLQAKEILPFIKEKRTPELDGSFGMISEVTIERTLHDLASDQVGL